MGTLDLLPDSMFDQILSTLTPADKDLNNWHNLYNTTIDPVLYSIPDLHNSEPIANGTHFNYQHKTSVPLETFTNYALENIGYYGNCTTPMQSHTNFSYPMQSNYYETQTNSTYQRPYSTTYSFISKEAQHQYHQNTNVGLQYNNSVSVPPISECPRNDTCPKNDMIVGKRFARNFHRAADNRPHFQVNCTESTMHSFSVQKEKCPTNQMRPTNNPCHRCHISNTTGKQISASDCSLTQQVMPSQPPKRLYERKFFVANTQQQNLQSGQQCQRSGVRIVRKRPQVQN